jgi:hypothetical protein
MFHSNQSKKLEYRLNPVVLRNTPAAYFVSALFKSLDLSNPSSKMAG